MRNNDIRSDEPYDWEQAEEEDDEKEKWQRNNVGNGHATTSNGPLLLNGK